MSQMAVKVLYVAQPVANATPQGTFYNQDVLVSELGQNNTWTMRVTSGPNRKDISTFHLAEGEEVELTFYARAQLGSKDNRLFNQLNITHVERDRTKWGQVHSTNDASDIVSRLKGMATSATAPATNPDPAASTAAAPAGTVTDDGNLPF